MNARLLGTRDLQAYGLWEATVRTPDGRTITERGWREGNAVRRAFTRAYAPPDTEKGDTSR